MKIPRIVRLPVIVRSTLLTAAVGIALGAGAGYLGRKPQMIAKPAPSEIPGKIRLPAGSFPAAGQARSNGIASKRTASSGPASVSPNPEASGPAYFPPSKAGQRLNRFYEDLSLGKVTSQEIAQLKTEMRKSPRPYFAEVKAGLSVMPLQEAFARETLIGLAGSLPVASASKVALAQAELSRFAEHAAELPAGEKATSAVVAMSLMMEHAANPVQVKTALEKVLVSAAPSGNATVPLLIARYSAWDPKGGQELKARFTDSGESQ